MRGPSPSLPSAKMAAQPYRALNRKRLLEIARESPTSLEGLCRLFTDDRVQDDGTTLGRLWSLLIATERRVIPGLQTAVPFDDSGFAGDRRQGGSGFKDPWRTSRNQPGHFLTAVGLRVAPETVDRPIPLLGSIRRIVGAPDGMEDHEVAVRLSIGHEKRRDPLDALPAAAAAIEAGLAAYRAIWTDDLDHLGKSVRVGAATLLEGNRQARLILRAFQAQFAAVTDTDLDAWDEALRAFGRGMRRGRAALEDPASPLNRIQVAYEVGNSVQDLRLTLVGWSLGGAILDGVFQDRRQIGPWLQETLGEE